ncbi:carbamoyl phosphate synthase small subunit [Ethanoligenens harbinense]|uniref:Carbamoyl phosphate synthase small chain n=1 Tax=Ethanoligenens harbinense (strain DSM 18485 / JCM 12961 / CGMCC 1.5033 / YUAN-3) TaxID=663278 RepID=E6U5E0_ETHHY|nr:carbamoyl phosphate synthase small subunit [Ethanoligenens harbinense]ADU25607.1 carbamoyl-phosphate synthase, small subunit [Ethanoligenens harbinense YUAN-3]AVQ94783.1 carbamoyl-phosphate synthase small subunit [Ethanoligenens harbinense YUAN-3]AYF37475.1 carbamoyl-phosphate synthase small subunit [Ethanoligenens harbinense]AYF40194.1 carbamoyl-phosphate synthase small subunit [Ethanoligenens harbinense]QCN91030.1 carbamoyl-phosphate synthase small subunit [Ethanoligenens harbinense]
MTKAYLLLADGTVFEGVSIGARGTSIGETVFNTGMTGYQETLTDASYYGQIVTQTYPLVGNYGVNGEDVESRRSWVRGYIVRENCEQPSNFRCAGSLDTFLKEQGVVGLCGIDTRRLTRLLREHGVMNGAITDSLAEKDALLEAINAYSISGAVEAVTVEKPFTEGSENGLRVALLDYGYKVNILRSLVARGCRVTVFPASASPADVLASRPDGIMLSNGPGDPSACGKQIENLREIFRSGAPIFGICLGHQLMALAQGGRTEKLKYGHRGANHPVKDLAHGRTYITSQNHGYAVVDGSIGAEVGAVSHVNLNDGTVEGVRYKNAPVFTVQFHPEASPGPHDSAYLFDEFVALMKERNLQHA